MVKIIKQIMQTAKMIRYTLVIKPLLNIHNHNAHNPNTKPNGIPGTKKK